MIETRPRSSREISLLPLKKRSWSSLRGVLKPFSASNTDHPAFTIPMVVLSVHVLLAYGYKMFVPSIFPSITPATIHSIGLHQNMLHEISRERFVVELDQDIYMSSIDDAQDHPDVLFNAFFDINYINQHKRRTQQFDHLIMFFPGYRHVGNPVYRAKGNECHGTTWGRIYDTSECTSVSQRYHHCSWIGILIEAGASFLLAVLESIFGLFDDDTISWCINEHL